MKMEDALIFCLKDLCLRYSDSGDPLDGRYEVARRSGLSEQYLYQILASKPMANGSLRSVGKIAREKLSAAFPDWLAGTSAQAPEGNKRNNLEELSPQALAVARAYDAASDELKRALMAIAKGIVPGAQKPRRLRAVFFRPNFQGANISN